MMDKAFVAAPTDSCKADCTRLYRFMGDYVVEKRVVGLVVVSLIWGIY